MRLPVLAALLAAGLSGPAAAAIDLGPIAYGFGNRIVVPLEALALGDYSEDVTLTVTGAPRDKAVLRLSARSPVPESFEHQELGVLLGTVGSSVGMIAGVAVFAFDPRAATTFRLLGEIIALPASYELQVAITPLPATVLLLAPAITAFGLARSRGRTQRSSRRGG